MSELISKTRLLMHRSPIEPIQYTETTEQPEIKKLHWKKRTIAMLAGYLAFVGADNAQYYYDTALVEADDGVMLYDIDGCDPFPKPYEQANDTKKSSPKPMTEIEIKETQAIELEFKSVESAAKHFEPKKFNLKDFLFDWYNIHQHEQFRFTSEISGLAVHVYTDTPENPFVIADEQKVASTMDELIHSSLDPSIDYKHVGVAAYKDCLRDRFIHPNGPRELEGKRLNIYIPSQPGACFSNGLVQDIPDNAEYHDFCDSLGATKDIRLAARPFYTYRRNWMVYMTNNLDKPGAERELSKKLIHESTHFLMETAGMPFRYDPNERLADYLEDQIVYQLYDNELPVSLQYPYDRYNK